jgi:LacI family transcriptional regulator
MQERKRGVISALEEAGIQPKKEWFKDISFDKVETDMKNAMNEMLQADDPVHAVVFGTYRLAINGLKYIRQLDIKIPQQLAIVSYGQAESFELYECPITYLEQPLGELGRKAVELLISKLHDPQRQPQRILMETKLKIGESSRLPDPRI